MLAGLETRILEIPNDPALGLLIGKKPRNDPRVTFADIDAP